MILKAIIAIDDTKGTAQIVGWKDATGDDLMEQVSEDMSAAGHAATRYLELDIAIPAIPPVSIMRLEPLK